MVFIHLFYLLFGSILAECLPHFDLRRVEKKTLFYGRYPLNNLDLGSTTLSYSVHAEATSFFNNNQEIWAHVLKWNSFWGEKQTGGLQPTHSCRSWLDKMHSGLFQPSLCTLPATANIYFLYSHLECHVIPYFSIFFEELKSMTTRTTHLQMTLTL